MKKTCKKIGIVTITNGQDNYGNVLQNYALQIALRKVGYDSETINNISFVEYRSNYLYLIPKFILKPQETKKTIKFEVFKHKFIKYSREKYKSNNKALPELKNKYYKFICGSDQIWNPNYEVNTNWKISLLQFADDTQRIAYAASFGIETLEKNDEILFKNELMHFKAISVRESSAVEIVNLLIGEKPSVVLDPTLLLSVEEWNKVICPISKLVDIDFILVYVLGDQKERIQDYIKSSSDKIKKSIVIDIMNPDKAWGTIGPSEFIWLIKHATLVITDSFHATVFSILYTKNFMVFRRMGEKTSTEDRLNTLLSLFSLSDHVFDEGKNELPAIDNEKIKNILNTEKELSFEFLKEAIRE